MTKQRDLKQKIRARMQKTGERYTAARAQVLREARPKASAWPGVLEGYTHFGGLQDDTAVLAHLFAHAGLRFEGSASPYSEAMLHGLCGGVGFLYAVFEYKGWPPMLTIVPRSRTMPQTYIAPLFERVGIEATTQNSSSAAAARKKLDAALDAGKPALCMVDACLLPHSALPRQLAGAGPHHVAVIGREGENYWIDDRALRPIRISASELDDARAAYRAGKRAMTTLGAIDDAHDWRAAWLDALRDTARTLLEGDPTVPKSFRVNTGLAGLEKWQGLLTHPKDKKGWSKVFPAGAKAYAGLRRAYDGICHEYTAPAAGRPLYADFLELAATQLELPALAEVAREFATTGEAWERLATCISGCEDAAVRRACELADARARALDELEENDDGSALEAMVQERRKLGDACELDARAAGSLYAEMAEILGEIVAAERRGAMALAEVTA